MKFKVEDLLKELHQIYIDGYRTVDLNFDSDDVDYLSLSVCDLDEYNFESVEDYFIDSIPDDYIDDLLNTNSSFSFTDITIESLTWLYDVTKNSNQLNNSHDSVKENLASICYLITYLSCGYSNPNSKEISLILTALESYRLYILKNDFDDKDLKRTILSGLDKELKETKKILKSFNFKTGVNK